MVRKKSESVADVKDVKWVGRRAGMIVRTTSRSHARTVVRECCKGDDESQWERGKFDPPPPKNPLTDGHQNLSR